MDLPESTKVVYNRIQKLEPENASKILGYLLLQEHSDREMIRLAFSPDNFLYSYVNKAKTDLGLSPPPPISLPQVKPTPSLDLPLKFTQFSPTSPHSFSSPTSLRMTNACWDPQVTADQQQVNNFEFVSPLFSDSGANDYCLENQLQFLSLDDQIDSLSSTGSDFPSNYYPEPSLGPRMSWRSPCLPEFPVKVCHYFIKGFCKHGNNCKYFHGRPLLESCSQMYSNELSNEDHTFLPGSLEKLELEITELLKSKRGFPVSIASLPMLYYEKYGRTLQAEGYLTESQRHGKVGYSLTKVLARLKNSIRLINRPHGQHSVILSEDIPRYIKFIGERSDHGGIVAGSRQIYLTFPADSTFTEQDVSNYFNNYGPVQDVRIPCQQKRMFGFVTFVFSETVKQILAKGNPHFVCGARVLVKPYREKSRLIERRHGEKVQHSMYCYGSHFVDPESELHSMPRVSDNSRLLNKQVMEEHPGLELERRHLSELQGAPRALNHCQYFGYSMDELKLSEARADQRRFPSADHFNYLLDVFSNGSTTTDEKVRHINTNYIDQESSQGLNLPDSPFAPPMGSGISTVT